MGVKKARGEMLCTFAGMASLALGSGLCGFVGSGQGAMGLCAALSPWGWWGRGAVLAWGLLWCFRGCRGGLVGCVWGRGLGAGAPRLLGFALLVVFVGALLVVSVLDIIWDCCLWPSYWSRGINYSCFIVLVGKPFPGCQGACVAFHGLSCW